MKFNILLLIRGHRDDVLLPAIRKTDEGVTTDADKSDTYFQYSIWWAFTNKVFDADL